jgi:hypothetical protein
MVNAILKLFLMTLVLASASSDVFVDHGVFYGDDDGETVVWGT